MVALDARVRRRPDVLSRELEGETVMVELTGGAYYGLNAVGTRVWELIGDGTTVRAVLAALLEEFEVDPAVAQCDVLALLEQLAEKRLVALEPPA